VLWISISGLLTIIYSCIILHFILLLGNYFVTIVCTFLNVNITSLAYFYRVILIEILSLFIQIANLCLVIFYIILHYLGADPILHFTTGCIVCITVYVTNKFLNLEP